MLNIIRTAKESSRLAKPLALFASQRILTDEGSCNAKGLEILQNNSAAAGGLVRYGIRPIDKVIQEFARRHAKICAPVYPKQFVQIRSKLDEDLFAKVRLFAESMIRHGFDYGDYPLTIGASSLLAALNQGSINWIRQMDGRPGRRNATDEASIMYEILESESDLHPGQLPLLGRERVEQLFDEHLVKPCEHYANEIGLDIYLPAEFDAITKLDSKQPIGDERSADSDENIDYKLGLAYYKACHMYILEPDRSELIGVILKSSSGVFEID